MTDDVWEVLCAGTPLFAVLFALNVVLLVTLLLVFPFTRPESESYWISVMSFVIIGASLVGLVGVIRRCRARETA